MYLLARCAVRGLLDAAAVRDSALRRQNPAWLNLSYVDAPEFDRGMIEAVYDFLIEECDGAYKLASGLYHSPDDWANGSYEVVKVGLRNRFVNERADLLAMVEEADTH
jgi:hypothetical protein